ncbi:ATP-binding protein [Streptomyces polygonati]|uniref:ATP-binding protein n=1 Tax=Streptomyces polygonati TaxID=1617087 RepID=A0ABV8HWT7_9ACTN
MSNYPPVWSSPPPPHLSTTAVPPEPLPPPFWLDRLELPLESIAASEARRHASRTLRNWGLGPAIIENAELIVSELAANAVRHSRPPKGSGRFALTLCRLPAVLQIYVYDDDPRSPLAQQPTDDETCGRGLLLIRELTDHWGCLYPRAEEGPGKAVLAELRLGPVTPDKHGDTWDTRSMPPMPADPAVRARITAACQAVIAGGPFIYGDAPAARSTPSAQW